jgi:hypothetical protein
MAQLKAVHVCAECQQHGADLGGTRPPACERHHVGAAHRQLALPAVHQEEALRKVLEDQLSKASTGFAAGGVMVIAAFELHPAEALELLCLTKKTNI